jgi:uncharacterized protein YoaH (UPF0181 family)
MTSHPLARLGLALALVAPLAACALSPAAAERVAELEAERAVLVEERDALAAEAQAARELWQEAEAKLDAAVQAGEADAIAAARAERDAALDVATAKLEELLQPYAVADAAVAAKTKEIAEVEAADVGAQAQGILGPLAPFIPAPAQPVAVGLAALAPWIASKRSRQHLARSVRELNPLSAGGMAPGEAIASIARAFGFEHSTEDPAALLDVVRAKAEAKGLEIVQTGEGPKLVELGSPADPDVQPHSGA